MEVSKTSDQEEIVMSKTTKIMNSSSEELPDGSVYHL